MTRTGRENTEIRPVAIEQGILSRSDGSCRFSFGDTVVLVSVNGPMEVKPRNEIIDKTTLEVIFKPLIGLSTCKDRVYEEFIRSSLNKMIALNQNPRSLVQIIIQVVMDKGSILAASLNGAIVALLDAGVPLLRRISSCSFGITEDQTILIDLVKEEEELVKSRHVVCFSTDSTNVLTLESSGVFSADELQEILCRGEKICSSISSVIFQSVMLKLKRTNQNVKEMEE